MPRLTAKTLAAIIEAQDIIGKATPHKWMSFTPYSDSVTLRIAAFRYDMSKEPPTIATAPEAIKQASKALTKAGIKHTMNTTDYKDQEIGPWQICIEIEEVEE